MIRYCTHHSVRFALRNATPYLALTGELWGVFREWVMRRKTTAIYRERTVSYSSLLYPQEHMSAGCSLPPGVGDTPRGTCHNIPFTYYEPPRCMPQAQHPSTKRKCSGSINAVPDPNSGELREYFVLDKETIWVNHWLCHLHCSIILWSL